MSINFFTTNLRHKRQIIHIKMFSSKLALTGFYFKKGHFLQIPDKNFILKENCRINCTELRLFREISIKIIIILKRG